MNVRIFSPLVMLLYTDTMYCADIEILVWTSWT